MDESFFNYVDQVYIINLRRRPDRRLQLQERLKPYTGRLTWIDAWNGQLPAHQEEYDCIIDQLEKRNIYKKEDFERFKKWTLQPGALGCLKSHLKCIQDAKANGYKTVLVLEDDILIHQSIEQLWSEAHPTLPSDWQLVYLGRKQGAGQLDWINQDWYRANTTTWASHAWLIKSTFFHELIKCYSQYNNSVDNIVKDLAKEYPIYVYREDLFITTYDSDIRPALDHEKRQHFKKWGWELDRYLNCHNKKIQQIVIWGFTPKSNQDHTHTYIHQNIFLIFRTMFPNLRVLHCDDDPVTSCLEGWDNTLYFVSPTHGCSKHIPILDNSLYIIHIDDDPANQGDHDERFREVVNDNRGLYLACRHPPFGFQLEKRLLNLPWGANIVSKNDLSDESNTCGIHRKILQKYYQVPHRSFSKRPKIIYFGSIWSGNIDVITELVTVCRDESYQLQLVGRISPVYYRELKTINSELSLTPYSDYRHDDCFEKVVNGLGPVIVLSIQGRQHSNDYLSCRLFSNIAHGFLGISNNPLVKKVIPNDLVVYDSDIRQLLKKTYQLVENSEQYKLILQQQLLEVYYHHTYQNRVSSYLDALTTITSLRKEMISIPRAIDRLSRQYLMILSFQRSGSSVLMDLLGQFSNICSLQEIYQGGKVGLNSKLVDKIRKERGLNCDMSEEDVMRVDELVAFRDKGHYSDLLFYLEEHVEENLIAFKIFPDNILHLTQILEMARHPKFIPIILWRDFPEVYTSWKLAKKTGHYANLDYQEERVSFMENDFQPLSYMYKTWYQALTDDFKKTSTKYYSFDYHEISCNQVFTTKLKRFGQELGLDFGHVECSNIRSKQGAEEWRDHIENISEMTSYLDGSNCQIEWEKPVESTLYEKLKLVDEEEEKEREIQPVQNAKLPCLPYQLPYNTSESDCGNNNGCGSGSGGGSGDGCSEGCGDGSSGTDQSSPLSWFVGKLKNIIYHTFNWFWNLF